ncbi:MAG: glycosyltransferase family 1 protein, partial [Longimicrobiales bacterium]
MFATDPILTVHCFYQRPGGEDTAYRAESGLLEARGHRVERMEYHNDALDGISSAQAAVRAVWNHRAAREVAQRVRATGARLVHFHNTFPLLSPAVYAGARREGARVIQTLYNYRLVCPGALMLRDGAPCTACAGRLVAWPAVRHACYRDSRAASAVVATMLRVHRSAGTWTHQVDGYIAVSRFLRERMVEGGLPRERMHVKGPHLADDPGVGTHRGGFALFVGRIAEEKGLRVLVDAWRRLPGELPLRILGDGPLRAEIER